MSAQAQRQGLSRLTGGRRKDKGGNNGGGGALLALSIRSEMHEAPSISNLMTFAGQLLDTVMWGHDSVNALDRVLEATQRRNIDFIRIDTGNVTTTSFDITPEDKVVTTHTTNDRRRRRREEGGGGRTDGRARVEG